MSDGIKKSRGFHPSVLYDEILCFPIFEQRRSDNILPIEMLGDDHLFERFIDALKFCIEGTMLKDYLLYDGAALDIVIGSVKRKQIWREKRLFSR